MPAGRPVKKRTVKSYQRDLEALSRLKTAIAIDPEIPLEIAKKTTGLLDQTMVLVAGFARDEGLKSARE